MVDRMGGIEGLIKEGINLGAAGAVFGLGLGMGADEKAALGAAFIAHSQAGRIEDELQNHKDNIQLEKNEEEYKIGLANYFEKCRQIPGNENLTEEEMINHLNHVYELVDSKQYDELAQGISDADREMVKLYEPMYDSYDMMGVADASDMVKRLHQKVLYDRNK